MALLQNLWMRGGQCCFLGNVSITTTRKFENEIAKGSVATLQGCRPTHRNSFVSARMGTTDAHQVSPPAADKRGLTNYPPPIWTNKDFANSLTNKDSKQEEIYKDMAAKLEGEVRIMIEDSDASFPLQLLELIDTIQRLGLGYRFVKDITSALDKIISSGGLSAGEDQKNLHLTALRFRLLRQHGYDVSQEVFSVFKDDKGQFMESLQTDVKGLLSLYEASFMAFEGETLLDDAKSFAKKCLQDLKQHIKSNLLIKQIDHTLELPWYRRTLRFEARLYIEFYARKEDAIGSLLHLAKLDFNIVQSALQRDLVQVLRWWKNIELTSKLSFLIKDRLMECFFWTIGVSFEPQLSNCRVALTKVAALLTTIDDVYDVYGSLDELQLFTDSVKRWDVDAVQSLPDYMKLFFLALYNTVNEMAYDTLKQHGENTIPLLKKVWGDLCQALMQEARWNQEKFTPTLEDYIENGWRSSSGVVILAHAYSLRSQNITSAGLNRLEKDHDLLKWSSMIFRLCNDSGTLTTELERGETANAVACHMHDTGVSEEVARQHIRILIDDAWKKMNTAARIAESEFSKPFVEAAVNLARLSHSAYQHGDGHGIPDMKAKKRMLSLLVEPIAVDV